MQRTDANHELRCPRRGSGLLAATALVIGALTASGCPDKKDPPKKDPPAKTDGGATPAAGVVEAKWSRSGTLSYQYEGARPSSGPKTTESLVIEFKGGDEAEIKGVSGRASVSFAENGTIEVASAPDPDPRPTLPAYVHMFRIGAGAGKALEVGQDATVRFPADADIPSTQLTVQSEVKMTLTKLTGDVAEYDYESRYRVIDNDALQAFREDVDEVGAADVVDPILDDAKGFRLAGFGVVEFDVAKGQMLSASYTGAGLPLESLDRDALAKREDAIHYTVSLQGR